MTFSEGEVFRNIGTIFTYAPNKNPIRSRTYYHINGNFVLEYDNQIITNSDGLVQKREIDQSKPSILITGDSFTEGQGSSPWFYDLENDMSLKTVNLINGGFLGTGIRQFDLFATYISKKYHVEKIVVVYISHDWIRGPWIHTEATLACLRDHSMCRWDTAFISMPDNNDFKVNEFLENMHGMRSGIWKGMEIRDIKHLVTRRSKFVNKIRDLLRYVQTEYNHGEYVNDDFILKDNMDAAKNLVKRYGSNNVLFVQIMAKDEIVNGMSQLGKDVAKFLLKEKYAYINMDERSHLDLIDYHQHDGHPNKSGYKKIEKFMKSILHEWAGTDP